MTQWEYGGVAEAQDAFAYYSFYDRWDVEEELGNHIVQKMATAVLGAASPPMIFGPIRGIGTSYNSLGPLVSSTGMCLTSTSAGLVMQTCQNGSATQTWQSAGQGGTLALGLQDASICVEPNEWIPGRGADARVCSGSTGEQFTVTTANELRWQRDESYCLTASGSYPMLTSCNGSASQRWGRLWPLRTIGPYPLF